jgi:hypothetical protein
MALWKVVLDHRAANLLLQLQAKTAPGIMFYLRESTMNQTESNHRQTPELKSGQP